MKSIEPISMSLPKSNVKSGLSPLLYQKKVNVKEINWSRFDQPSKVVEEGLLPSDRKWKWCKKWKCLKTGSLRLSVPRPIYHRKESEGIAQSQNECDHLKSSSSYIIISNCEYILITSAPPNSGSREDTALLRLTLKKAVQCSWWFTDNR